MYSCENSLKNPDLLIKINKSGFLGDLSCIKSKIFIKNLCFFRCHHEFTYNIQNNKDKRPP